MERIGMLKIENVLPNDIERRSMQIIDEELSVLGIALDPAQAPVIKRCIHTSADFDYARNLAFSPHALEAANEALKAGCTIVTDTKMAYSGRLRSSAAKQHASSPMRTLLCARRNRVAHVRRSAWTRPPKSMAM